MQLDESVKKPEKDCCCRQAGLVIAPFRPRGYHSEPLHRGKPGTLGLDCSQIGRRTRGRWSVRVGLKTQRLNDWSPGYFGAIPKRLKRSRLRSGANWAQISTMQCQRHKRASTGESSNRNKEVQATLMPQQRYRDFSHGAPGHAPGSPLAPLLVICERGGGCKSRGPEEKPTTHRTHDSRQEVSSGTPKPSTKTPSTAGSKAFEHRSASISFHCLCPIPQTSFVLPVPWVFAACPSAEPRDDRQQFLFRK